MLGQHETPLLLLPPPDSEEKLANGNDQLSVAAAAAATAATATASRCLVSSRSTCIEGEGHMKNCDGSGLQQDQLQQARTQLCAPVSTATVTATATATFLESVSQCWAKTKKDLDRSGSIHVMWILVMVFYSVLGALLFKLLDGDASDAALATYRNRCVDLREELWRKLVTNCSAGSSMVSFDDCKHKTWNVMMLVDKCLRNSPPLMTVYSTSEFGNALIYAISIYTTIGYGTISVNSVSGQMVSILYAIVGIPLFFALISDLGQVFQRFFIKAFRAVRRLLRTTVLFRRLRPSPVANKKNKERNSSREMALIFACAVGLQILYFVGVSIVFARMERWEFSKSFYFLFQSIALIGLGDVFPHKPVCLLINVAFIMLGIVLLSMCFFILQQKIRKKTSDWSRRMHHSMHTWRYLQNSCQASPRDKLSSFGGSLCLAHRHSLPPHGFCCRKHRRMRKTFRWSLCCRSPSSEEASSVPSQPQLQASCIVRKFPFYGVLPFAPTSPPSCQSKRPSVVVKKSSYMPIPHSVIGLVSLTTYC